MAQQRISDESLLQASGLLFQLSDGYIGEYLSAAEFQEELERSIEKFRKGDQYVINQLWEWFTPTSIWDDFAGTEGEKPGNSIFERLDNLKRQKHLVRRS